MRVVFLGTTGYHPNDRRHTLAVFLPEVGVLLDAGTGLFRLPRYLKTSQLDILLSHAHLDHVVGLTYLLGMVHRRPLEAIRVHAQEAKLQAIEEHLFSELLFPVRPPLTMCPLPPAELPLPQGGTARWFPLEHPGGAVGYRLRWPQGELAYVTDTTATPEAPYLEAIRGVELLIHECYFPDHQAELARRTGHSHTSAVARLAAEAEVGQLVLVHMDPGSEAEDPIDLDRACRIFPATTLAHDELELSLGCG